MHHIGDEGVANDFWRLQCEFVQWFQNTFLTDSQYSGSGGKVTAYAYNYNLNTLTNGDALTPVGSA